MPYRSEYLDLLDDPAFEHWWKLDESAADKTVTDSVTGNTGTRNGDATNADRDVDLLAVWQATGQQVGWDGAERTLESITLASSPGTSATANEWSLAFFAKSAQPFTRAIISLTDRSNNRAFEIGGGSGGGTDNQRIYCRFSQSGSSYNKVARSTGSVWGNNTYPSGFGTLRWVHWLITYSTANEAITIYRDGEEIESELTTDSGDWGIFDATADLIVSSYDGNSDIANIQPVQIADIMLFSRALDAAEAEALVDRLEYIDPTRDTYLGFVPKGTDLQQALQAVMDTSGNANGSFQHATYHHASRIRLPHGHWYLGQSVFTPFGVWDFTIEGQGEGRRTGNSVSRSWTHIIRSPDWTGDNDALIVNRSQGGTFKKIRFVGTDTGDPADVVGIGVHQTRDGGTTTIPPSGMRMEECTGEGLVALHSAGNGKSENNCDFQVNIRCSITNCDYLFWNQNDQGQMQLIEWPIGTPNEALVYVECGGPIYLKHFGSAGDKTVLLLDDVEANQGHFVLDYFKFDAQADKDCKIVEMLQSGPAHITVKNGFITNGNSGAVGTNFVIRGQAILSIQNVVGAGKTLCVPVESPGFATRNPLVRYIECSFGWRTQGGYNESLAKLVADDPTVLLADGNGELVFRDSVAQSTFSNQGSISPNPNPLGSIPELPNEEAIEELIDDALEGALYTEEQIKVFAAEVDSAAGYQNATQITQLIAAGTLSETEVRAIYADEHAKRSSTQRPFTDTVTFDT